MRIFSTFSGSGVRFMAPVLALLFPQLAFAQTADDDLEIPANDSAQVKKPQEPATSASAPPVPVTGAQAPGQPAAPPGSPQSEVIPTPPATPAPSSTDIAALAARVARLEAELAESRRVPRADKPALNIRFGNVEATTHSRPIPLGTLISGYVQAQYEQNQLSQDQLTSDGDSYNFDRFSIRRARLRLDHGFRWVAAAIEIDGSSQRKSAVAIRRAEASFVYRRADGQLPLAMLTFGLFDVPFGRELVASSRTRLFMERSTASSAFFPNEPELGVRLSGAPGFLRYSLALINGQPVEGNFIDANAAKDLVGRIGVETPVIPGLDLSTGVSFLKGKGFHAGSPATKNQTVWRDVNENGVVDAGEVIGIPGRAALPSQSFDHWALGLDVEVRVKSAWGFTEVAAEGYVANNLDRASFVADPVQSGRDSREVGFYASLVQPLTPFAFAGFRYAFYDPNSDFFFERAGRLVPAEQTIQTLSPIVGVQLPGQARLVAQYDFVRDHLGRDLLGAPTDLKNDQFTLRLQGEL